MKCEFEAKFSPANEPYINRAIEQYKNFGIQDHYESVPRIVGQTNDLFEAMHRLNAILGYLQEIYGVYPLSKRLVIVFLDEKDDNPRRTRMLKE